MQNKRSTFTGRGSRFLTETELKQRPKVTLDLIKRIGQMLKPYWKHLALLIFTILVSTVFKIMPTILTERILNEGLLVRNLPVF